MEDKVDGFEDALLSGSICLLDYFPSSQSLDNFDSQVLKLPKQKPSESHHLPHLHSVEEDQRRPSNHPTRFPSSASAMRFPSPSFTSHSYTHLQTVASGNPCLPSYISSHSPCVSSPAPPCQIQLRKTKRLKITNEETQSLAKLVPWGSSKKMNRETTLSEAYKYIKYLQTQLNVLQSMPCESLILPPSASGCGGGASSGLGGLEKLNRQQLLQVVLNSPKALEVLSSQESCVYSLEQMLLLKNGLPLDFFPKASRHR